jgi:hypothetical protein
MKASEQFALDQWLTDYPEGLSFDEVLALMTGNEWTHDQITVWQVVEHFTLDQVADFIQDTKNHFERVTA